MMTAEVHSLARLDAALFYAGLGWSVVPAHKAVSLANGEVSCTCDAGTSCVSKGKHPAVGWTRWQTERASTDQIHRWFEGPFKTYGVGIITGAVSGIFVVDVDEGPGKSGGENLANLEMINGDFPHTVQAKTGGGGRHIIFAHPGGDTRILTSKNILGPGVDTRGDGGFIVAAPSLHQNGRVYLWDEKAHPKTTQIAEAPSWVVDMSLDDGTHSSVNANTSPTGHGEIVRDSWGRVTDGRERYMIGVICGVIASLIKREGALPSPEAVFVDAWPTYEKTARARGPSLEADGRGETLMRQRVKHFLKRAASGKWKIDVTKPQPAETVKTAGDAPDVYRTFSIGELMMLPPVEWMVEGLLTRDGFSVVYGPPASLKTFLCLSVSLCVAGGLPWMGKPTQQSGVLYVAAEGSRGVAKRVRAWQIKNKMEGVDLPFHLLSESVDMTDISQVQKLIRTAMATHAAEGCPIGLVILDTVARSIPGADENSAQDMGRFVAAIEKIKAGIGCHVMGVHHSGKDAEKGARGSSALLGAVDTMIQVKRADSALTVTVEKQKDDEEGEPIRLMVEKVEWMNGLLPVHSLAVTTDPHACPSQHEYASIHQKVAAAIGPGGKMESRRVAEALSLSGYMRDEMNQSIPFYPSYVEVHLSEGVCHLMRTRKTDAPNSPHIIVRTDIS